MTTPIAIIGAGPGGLAAAVLLAASGLPVTLYEAQTAIGGRTGRLTSKGYSFDRGPTFFMMPYVLDEILAAAGRRLSDLVPMRRLDPMYRLLVGQRDGAPIRLDATQDLDCMARQLDAVRPGDGEGFRRFMADNRTKLRLMTPILRNPIRGLRDLVSLDGAKVGPWIKPWQSLHDHLGAYFKHDAVRLAMSFQSKYLGMSPFECPSLFSILPYIEYEYGVWHPEGGCHALMVALATVAADLGVQIRCGEPVQALRFEGRRVTGLCAGGVWREHDHVVVNADATWAMKNLVPEALRGRNSDAAIDAKRYSCSTFMMYLGVRGELDLAHHTIYTSGSYRENLADIGAGRLSDDPSLYVCNPSRLDPSMAPPGCSSLYVLMPTANTRCGIDWDVEKQRLRRDALARVAELSGIADPRALESRLETEILFTPADWQRLNINHGATFNLAHNIRQMLHWRPQHRMEGFDGLWLVGGGTHPGSGLPVIFLSSQITSRLLCEELGVRCASEESTERQHAKFVEAR